jgi:NAD(P)-dependent dehydrogenase (short-subunit alcohol dehydrogenase family)
LGFALTLELLGRGYKVYAGSYLPDWPGLRALAEEHGPARLIVLPLDVTSDSSVAGAAAQIEADTGELHLVINNAGIAGEADRSATVLDDMDYAMMRRMFETNALGPLRVTHSVVRLLLKATPRTLVNVSSIAGSVSAATRITQYGYCMSKAALNSQSKLLYNHLKEHGVQVLVVHPGWMPSYIFGDPKEMEGAPVTMAESARGILSMVSSNADGLAGGLRMKDYSGQRIEW